MATFLYNLIIYPLYEIIEVVYFFVYRIFSNAGLAVLGVSVAVTFLCLPLYIISEKWQEIERDKQKEMKPGIDRIKKAFKGDEQYMILSTFYRQNHYHPLMALRSSFSLLIQIPFFIAAYTYLSNLEQLRGLSFLFIKDMGAPDAMFHIGSFPINVLPIAMTLINIASGIIYTKGFSLKEKAPIFAMALLFLCVLYNSPAGLVVYWTMNNIFSLVKNIFYKMKNPLKVLYICLCVAVLPIDYYVLFKHTGYLSRRIMLVSISSVVFLIPLIIKFFNYLLNTVFKCFTEDSKQTTKFFFVSAITFCVLVGFVIPSLVIASSPAEFSFIDEYSSPFYFLFNCFTQLSGLILVWLTCIYFLFGKKVKTLITLVVSLLAFTALINGFIFPGDYGLLSPNLQFSDAGVLKAPMINTLINLTVLLLPIILIIILAKFNKVKILTNITSFVLFALIIVSIINGIKIQKGYIQTKTVLANTKDTKTEISPVYHLSKTEKNVVVFMLDRAFSPYIPVIFEERPELKEKYSGFTYYPNTISFGNQTMAGTPPLLAGYDYTPLELNKRDKEALVDKHNEALLVVPRLFNNAGFKVTISDPSWANYSWVPDLRIYENDPDLTVFNAIKNYTDIWLVKNPELSVTGVRSSLMKRNFLWYSLLKTSPLAIRDAIYNKGNYWSTNKSFNDVQDVLSNYAVLDLLPELTDFTATQNTYTYITNELTHEPYFLQAPDYIPKKEITNFGEGPYAQEKHYHANIAALLRIGDWIDKLKENDVYDNTRIIIVSDHGYPLENDRFKGNFPTNPAFLQALLFVKDFNQTGELKTDNSFMTNADVPSLSMKELIENPINPNTGHKIDMSGKENGVLTVNLYAGTPGAHNKNTFKMDENPYFYVNNDITKPENWKQLSVDQALKGEY